MAEKTEQVYELRKDNESLKKGHNKLELLRELQSMVYDTPGMMIDAKNIQTISIEEGENIVLALQRHNTITREAIESGQQLPFETYIMARSERNLVSVGITIDFDKRKIEMSPWRQTVQ